MTDNMNSSLMESKGTKTTDNLPLKDILLPNPQLNVWMHELKLDNSIFSIEEKNKNKELLLEAIKTDEMLPFYHYVCNEFDWIVDDDFAESLSKCNMNEMISIEEKLKEAEKNFEDFEVKNCLLEKSNFLLRIGDIDSAIAAYDVAKKKAIGPSSQLNIILTLIRIGLLYGKNDLIKKNLTDAKNECEKSGDWQKRNTLKVYEAILLIQHKKFKEAGVLLLECIPIFTATELLSYEKFILITVLVSMMSLARPNFKESIISCPEVTQVVEEFPVLKNLVHSYYYCKYENMFESLVAISDYIKKDLFFYKHLNYFIHSIRCKIYDQFLEPFSVVSTHSMADIFCVSKKFIQEDLVNYIALGKLNCKIDGVNNLILHTKSTHKEKHYLKIMKEGDILLSKIQKLSKIIDI